MARADRLTQSYKKGPHPYCFTHKDGESCIEHAGCKTPFNCRIEQKPGSVNHPKTAKTGDVRAFTHTFAEGKEGQAIEKYKLKQYK
jgi:hypothetical protein